MRHRGEPARAQIVLVLSAAVLVIVIGFQLLARDALNQDRSCLPIFWNTSTAPE